MLGIGSTLIGDLYRYMCCLSHVSGRLTTVNHSSLGCILLSCIVATATGLLIVTATHANSVYSVDPISGQRMLLCGQPNEQDGTADCTADGDALSEARLSRPLALLLSIDESRLFLADRDRLSILTLK